MDPNAALLHRCFSSLNRHDHREMAECYRPDAVFHDIAFDLRGRERIHLMWQMICAGDIQVTFEVVGADAQAGLVRLVDVYTFSETGRPVRNPIESQFKFRDGLILEQHDLCDARAWAAMAIGGIAGFWVGRLRFLRCWKAQSMLRHFERRTARSERTF
jgi:ketosteroid isomerase-like protein